jgi:hypothetical protein
MPSSFFVEEISSKTLLMLEKFVTLNYLKMYRLAPSSVIGFIFNFSSFKCSNFFEVDFNSFSLCSIVRVLTSSSVFLSDPNTCKIMSNERYCKITPLSLSDV